MTAPALQKGSWLYGPAPDLLFGCGLLYALLFTAFAVFGSALRAQQPEYLVPLLVILVSMPHYGGTLVRVYDQRADRRSYALFSVWATLLVAGLFVWGTYSSLLASWLFTIYLTWSPWHYTGQNYGLALMFLRRRGIQFGSGTKRLLYASFLLAYLLTFLVFHSKMGVINYGKLPTADTTVVFLPLGIPEVLHRFLFPLVALAYALTLAAATVLLLRSARVRDLVPTAALVLTQALWFSIPYAVRYFGVTTGIEPLDAVGSPIQDYFAWIALGHSVQYLWITSYYARGSMGWNGYTRYFAKTLASGVAVWMLPVALFAPVARGHFDYAGGLGLLVASVVNIHHFILDGAIWKLRHTKIASLLIRAQPERPPGAAEPALPERSWLRRAAWATATAGLAVGLCSFWYENFTIRDAFERGDYAAAGTTLDRMAWLGRDSSAGRVAAAHGALRAGDTPAAERQLRRAFELQHSTQIQLELGELREKAGDWEAASSAYEDGLAAAPGDPALLERMARADWKLGRRDQALARLASASGLQPDSAALHFKMATLAKELGDASAAIRFQREAVQLAPGDHGLCNDLAWTLATSRDETLRDPEEAIRLAESLVHASETPDPSWLDTLAAAYAAAHRFDEAVRVASQAAALAGAQGQTMLGDRIQARLVLYRRQRPYVEAESANGA